jgi:Zn-dependent membrane protease YugP
MKIKSAYSKYSRVPNARGVTGVEAAQTLLQANELEGVQIQGTPGALTDNYNPRNKSLNLSQGVANGRSIAGLAVVAHEVGHAVQDRTGYGPMRLRSGIVPLVQVSSAVGPIIFILGYMLGWSGLAWLGLLLFSAGAIFALITVPVERNASARALQMLTTTGLIVQQEEQVGARKVLDAAALTYVAALVQALGTLLYYVMLLTGGSSRRRR